MQDAPDLAASSVNLAHWFYQRHRRAAHRYLTWLDPEEVDAELMGAAYLGLCDAARCYDPLKGSWTRFALLCMNRMWTTRWRSLWREGRHRPLHLEDLRAAGWEPASPLSVEQQAIGNVVAEEMLSRLTPMQAAAVRCRAAGLGYRETAAILGCTPKQADNYSQKGINRLRALYERNKTGV